MAVGFGCWHGCIRLNVYTLGPYNPAPATPWPGLHEGLATLPALQAAAPLLTVCAGVHTGSGGPVSLSFSLYFNATSKIPPRAADTYMSCTYLHLQTQHRPLARLWAGFLNGPNRSHLSFSSA